MLTGISFEKAIEYWKNGKEVIVIDRNSKNSFGGYDNFPFEELFRNVELLADVPAVENPEFNQAVADMVQQKPEPDQEESSEEESSAPPNEAGGEGASGQERKRKSGEGQADGSEGSDHCGDR